MKTIIVSCIWLSLWLLSTGFLHAQDTAESVVSLEETAGKKLTININTNLGYASKQGDLSSGTLAYAVGGQVAYRFTKVVAIQSGLELKKTGFRLESKLGGLSGAESDFVEKFNYSLFYLAVPVCAKFIVYKDTEIYVGPVVNVGIGGNTRYKRTGTGLHGVDDTATNKIKNQNPYAVSLRIGANIMFSKHWGWQIEDDFFLMDAFKTSSNKKSKINSISTGVIYRF